jgi:hypothetical protein
LQNHLAKRNSLWPAEVLHPYDPASSLAESRA